LGKTVRSAIKIQIVVRHYEEKFGLARYTTAILQALGETGTPHSLISPNYPLPVRAAHGLLTHFGFDVQRFFTTYPVAVSLDRKALKHLTAQQMATLLWTKAGIHPVVITVHDIVPYLVRHDPEQSTFRHPFDVWFDKLAMEGLKRADWLIAISQFTKKTLVEALACPEEKIDVVLYGVDHTVFRPVPVPADFRTRYGLEKAGRCLLYVGAESPRKNLPRLLQALAMLKERVPDVRLVKVGTPEYRPQFQKLKQLIRDLALEESVQFIDHPPEEDLVVFYNMADIFVFPSLYEGFGLPPLEAMACGTPVVCSNAASLPEVVGDAAITVDPYDVEALAQAMHRVLSNEDLRQDLSQRGLARAAGFTWERTARETVAVYKKVLG
jgi:glycosyltransferase involved in cell wall biosynthesis